MGIRLRAESSVGQRRLWAVLSSRLRFRLATICVTVIL
jgi:hypothetical protein